MKSQKQIFRPLFFLFLLTCLVSGLVGVLRVPVSAASSNIVISQVYGGGGNAGAPYTNDFVELFNLGSSTIDLTNWSIQYATANGTSWTSINLSGSLLAGQYYLIQLGPNGAIGAPLPTPDITAPIVPPATTPLAISSTDGKIALVSATTALSGACPTDGSIIDFIGYGTANCFEGAGTAPAPSNTTADIRSPNQCIDSDDNSSDFVAGTPNPRSTTSSPFPVACLVVTGVTSPLANGTYPVGTNIDITVTFSGIVDVTGTPTLLLATGGAGKPATYVSGGGSNTLTFRYTIATGDVSDDLDYVAPNSLSLDGGTIIGASGNAILILPPPGSPNSLGGNKDIAIANTAPPSTISFTRQNPISEFTNADNLTFRVTFSEVVMGVDAPDFIVTGVSGFTISVAQVRGNVYDVTIAGGNLATLNGVVGLNFNPAQDIVDDSANPLPSTEPPIDEIYTVDNTPPPTVTIDQVTGQPDPANTVPVNFTVVFSKSIDVTSFTVSDITQNGTARFITWSITNSGDNKVFTLSAISIAQNGTLIPSIAANQVRDLVGNFNADSTSSDNSVDFNDNVRPLVTIDQAVGQVDPANAVPIRFSVVFSEPINVAVFTPSDITQNGTATGITWTITDSGDHKNFTLSATAITGAGTLIPSIAANRVTDMVGNINLTSTSKTNDNSVTYTLPPPVIPRSVIINEIAWSGTKASEDDEWIELYNTTDNPIDMTGWILKSDDNTPTILLSGYTIPGKSYFLLARKTGTFKDVTPNLVYGDTGTVHTLVNGGEILRLKNASGTDIDIANSYSGYGFARWAAGSGSPNYASMERKAFNLGTTAEWFTFAGTAVAHDRNNNLVNGTPGKLNWALSVIATPSPAPTAFRTPTPFRTFTPVPPPPPALIAINEFVPRPGHDWNNDGVINVGDEYIELINHGVINVNLSGYSLDDEANIGSSPYRLPAVTLKPGERMVFYGADTGLLLSDGGDGVRLLKPNGQLGDAYNYSVVKYPDQAYCRLPDNGGLDDWNQDCFPTPGLKNSLNGNFPKPPTGEAVDQSSSCPISDVLPIDFVWAECPSFGNIWSRFYWDVGGWFGEKNLPDIDSKWDVYVD